jgi:hypothetical protein
MFGSIFRKFVRRPAPAANLSREEKKWDRELEEYRRDRPGATFAEFYAAKTMDKINSGGAHPTLGAKLNHNRPDRGPDREFRTTGKAIFRRQRSLFAVAARERVVDYGCGSLRLGVHWIEYLEPENYMGLDVTRDFLDIGIGLVGEAVIAQKKPHLAAISEASLAEAVAFGADFVFSHAVAFHVHPDEFGLYAANLVRIAHKTGTTLAVNAILADKKIRFRQRGWAHTLAFYNEAMKPLDFVAEHSKLAITDERAAKGPLYQATIEYRRA